MQGKTGIIGIPYTPDYLIQGGGVFPALPKVQVDDKTFVSLLGERPIGNSWQSAFRTVLGTPDPVASAKRAWKEEKLWQEALRVAHFPKPVPKKAHAGIRSWEKSWSQYVAHSRESTAPRRKEFIAKKFSKSFMERSPLTVSEILERCTDAELNALHSAALLIGFFKGQGIEFKGNASIIDLFKSGAYNCASISLVSLHLLQKLGVTAFESLTIPGHATLALRLDCGLTVYLNNGTAFLPPGSFNHPKDVTGFHQSATETAVPAWAAIANAYVTKGSHLNANSASEWLLYKGALLLNPRDPIAQYDAGKVLASLGLPAPARASYRAALRTNPHYDLPHAQLGLLLAREGRMKEAFAHTRRASETGTDKIHPWQKLGEELKELGKLARAIAAFEEVLKIDPDNVNAHTWAGRCHHDLKNDEEAKVHYLALLRLNDSDAWAFNNLGVIYEDTGELERARECYRLATELKPESKLYRENYRNVLPSRQESLKLLGA